MTKRGAAPPPPPKRFRPATCLPRHRARRKRFFRSHPAARPKALCAIWQTVKADAHRRPPFSFGNAAARGVSGFGRNIPWKSISIPWIRRSKGWKFRSKASFRVKNGAETCHIVAKKPFSGVPAAGPLMLVFESQTFLIFAYLRATERAHGKNAFSVLKSKGPFAVRPGWHIPCGVPRGKFDPFGAVCMCELSFHGFACVSLAVIE